MPPIPHWLIYVAVVVITTVALYVKRHETMEHAERIKGDARAYADKVKAAADVVVRTAKSVKDAADAHAKKVREDLDVDVQAWRRLQETSRSPESGRVA